MAITWAQALDYDKVTIVSHNGSYTRTLIEKSGYFAVQISTAAQAELVSELGAENNSRFDNADKMKNVEIFYQDDSRVPLIASCAAWLVCKRIPEPHNEQSYDLFIGEVVAAYADERIFDGGHWLFEKIPDELKNAPLRRRRSVLSGRQSGRYQAHAHKRRIKRPAKRGLICKFKMSAHVNTWLVLVKFQTKESKKG